MADGTFPTQGRVTRQDATNKGTGLPGWILASNWVFDSAELVETLPPWQAKQDARYNYFIDSWDTPFTALEGDVAAYGMRVDVCEPHPTYAWSGATSFLSDLRAATSDAVFTTFTNATKATQLVLDGRVPNLVEYWSAGAPLWYGAGQRGRVAVHYHGVLRPQVGRSWFSAEYGVEFSLAFAGNGYIRVTKTVGGVTTDVRISGTVGYQLTEADWLDQGYRFTEVLTLAPGDALDVYYVQNQDLWGGVVAKVLLGHVQTEELAADAPVLGSGLFDTGTQPPIQAWKHVERVQVKVDQQQASQATFTVPLVNPEHHDGFGWEWRTDSTDDPGYLVCWNGGVEQFQLRRGRLVRVRAGYIGEEDTLFTGIIQDIPTPQDGLAQIQCIGFEYRLLEARNRLEPDPISYMTFGYRALTGVSEPVYGITAYDAWTIEQAVADSAYRAGIDASRMAQPLTVVQADGSEAEVTYGSVTFNKFRARSINVPADYIRFRSTCTGVSAVTPGNTYDYEQIGAPISYTVQSGDVLEYEVWHNANNPEFKGAIDIIRGNTNDNLRSAGFTDQNALSCHPSTDLSAFAKGKWYKRRISLTAWAGSILTSWAVAFEGDTAGNYEAFFRNITIVNSGVTAYSLYESGSVAAAPWRLTAGIMPNGYVNSTVDVVLQDGAPLRLERPVHYGNVGTQFNEAVPVDDPYLFTPESRDDSWSRVLEIADRYGYDIRFDADGDFVLSTRANASYAYDFEDSDGTLLGTRNTHPSAYRGAYIEWNAAVTVTKQVRGARIDLALPRGPSLGNWSSITVKRVSDNTTVATFSNVAVAADLDTYYYDYRSDPTGTNATLLTVFSGDFDDYVVQLVGTGAATRRVDAIFVYHTDPLRARYTLSTLENALSVNATAASDDMRNIVTIVGTRKAATTDSEKFKTNPNNPDPEFVVEAAVDAASIVDPAAPNYIGMRKESMIIDSKVTDQDFAAYLARTFIYRYRTPHPPADIKHTLIPPLQLRQPLTADEAMFKSVTAQGMLWVTGYEHDIDVDGTFTTSISTSAWPEFPSFEPRDDIDIDVDFAGVPVSNVDVRYTSCSGDVQVNLAGSGLVKESTNDDVVVWSGVALTGTPEYLDMSGKDWPPVPGTVLIRPSTGGVALATEEYPGGTTISAPASSTQLYTPTQGQNVLKIKLSGVAQTLTSVQLVTWYGTEDSIAANPKIPALWQFMPGAKQTLLTSQYSYDARENVLTVRFEAFSNNTFKQRVSVQVAYNKYASRNGAKWLTDTPYHHLTNVDYRDSSRRIYLPWAQGDARSVYKRDTSVTTYDVKYRRLGAVDGVTKAYTASYPGGSPFFDLTTSELGYLITLSFDALVSGLYRISVRSAFDDTIVAYLTEPSADPHEPESHWQFISAGRGKSLNWDGVDQLGVWNRKQSDDYAAMAQGWFESDTKEAIGSGWYVWNREFEGGTYGRLALISDARNADGTPVYGQGTYAAWYFQIECKNDLLAARADEAGTAYPRVTRTIEPRPDEVAPNYSTGPGTVAGVVYTHLPAPTTLDLEVADWKEAYAYDPSDSSHKDDSHWQAPVYNDNANVRITDTFTDTAGTALEAHSGELGGTWTATAGTATISSTGTVLGSGTTMYYNTTAGLNTADYDVLCTVRLVTATTGTGGVVGRLDAAAQNGYWARYDNGANVWELLLMTGGSSSSLGTFSQSLTLGQDYALRLQMRGTTIKLFVNEVERISVTNSVYTAAGVAGLRLSGTASTNTTGLHLDNFSFQGATFEGQLSNQKPTRIRFRVGQRPGVLWANNSGEAEVKLTRHVHLKAQVFDQVMVGEGTHWVSDGGDTGVEQRTIYNRSFHNDDHTLVFTDEGWRKANTLKSSTNPGGVTEWIFKPEDFKKDFGRGENESLVFGDYLQLEEVPKWEQHRSTAAAHSRFVVGFIAYLFYLSTYCIDRSGRRTWGINRKFVDRSKIAHNSYVQWWDPANPTTPATASTFTTAQPYDPVRQQRRSVICRQWTSEGTWQADQRTRWGFASNSIGDKLLRHKWQDHEPTTSTLNGSTWPGLVLDQHSKWHTDGRAELPGAFSNLTRQLGANGSTQLNTWTWESDPLWVPCVTRDFHPYFRLPPMAAPTDQNALATGYIYGIVDTDRFTASANTGQDAARSQTWNSRTADMTELYSSGNVRFATGTKTDAAVAAVTSKSLDYVRQDDCAKFEDFRGIFTRGARPAEAVTKVVPTKPYYINMLGYNATGAQNARGASVDAPFPLFTASVAEWFRLSFRTEYIWESSTFFPVDYQNRELLEQMNVWKTRFVGDTAINGPQPILYDAGGWVGWKDDLSGNTLFQTNVFETGYMPFTVGPELPTTADMYVHLILVSERRNTPV